jgi:hypothetical protein
MNRRSFLLTVPVVCALRPLIPNNLGYPGISTELAGNPDLFYANGFEELLVKVCHGAYKAGRTVPIQIWNKNTHSWYLVERETSKDLVWKLSKLVSPRNSMLIFVKP